jgi:ethanolamine ammonia-lyase small subunit
VNQRGDKSWGVQTSKYEIENYLHTDAIAEAFGVQVNVGDGLDANGLGVPALFAQMMHIANPVGCPMKDGTAKKKLSAGAFPLMTAARIAARDPLGEVEGWFRRIGTML